MLNVWLSRNVIIKEKLFKRLFVQMCNGGINSVNIRFRDM